MSRRCLLPAMLYAVALAGFAGTSGCTSLGLSCDIPAIPVRKIPRNLLGRPRADMQDLSFTRLRQNPVETYQIGPGDVLLLHVPGVYPEIVSTAEQVVVKQEERTVFQVDTDAPPAEGVPIIVRADGSIALRSIEPIQASGLTLEQLSEVIRRAYLDVNILKPGNDRVLVNIYSRRKFKIMVMREDTGSGQTHTGGKGVVIQTALKKGSGSQVELPAYENDVLHALTETGGLPGLDAANEVVIIRAGFNDGAAYDQVVAQILSSRQPCECKPTIPDPPNVLRIPLRFFPENVPQFTEEDIILEEGDVVYVPGRETDKYYTGGVLPGGEHLLPRDYDLDVMAAIAVAGGPVGGGGSGISGIGGNQGGGGFGGGGGGLQGRGGLPPTNLVVIRKLPCGGQIPIKVDLKKAMLDDSERILVQPGDTLILRYTICEEVYNTALGLLQFNYLFGSGR
ncbi:MAG TPA: polysaccharide biosynthesis/export family protein [Caulifigura sp.]|nr:polysaccharide biosynthesis/export family protein [Caulifigura sp.]